MKTKQFLERTLIFFPLCSPGAMCRKYIDFIEPVILAVIAATKTLHIHTLLIESSSNAMLKLHALYVIQYDFKAQFKMIFFYKISPSDYQFTMWGKKKKKLKLRSFKKNDSNKYCWIAVLAKLQKLSNRLLILWRRSTFFSCFLFC